MTKRDGDKRGPLACAHNGNDSPLVSDYTRDSLANWRRRRRQIKFLRAYRTEGTVPLAASKAGITVTTVYAWIARDPLFAEHYEGAKEYLVERLEQEAIHQALVGDEQPLVSMGRVVTTVRKKNPDMLKFLLAAKKPKEYGRKSQSGIELSKDAEGNASIKAYVGVDLDQV